MKVLFTDIDAVLVFSLPPRYWKLSESEKETSVCFWSTDLGNELQGLDLENLDQEIDQYFEKDPIIDDQIFGYDEAPEEDLQQRCRATEGNRRHGQSGASKELSIPLKRNCFSSDHPT